MLIVYIFVICPLITEKHIFSSVLMIISDANPVQFWLVECETYNEQTPFGKHRRCFCAPWECDDEITIQFTDDGVTDYGLIVMDENSNEVYSEMFDVVGTTYTVSFLPSSLSPEICDTKVSFRIVELSSPENIIAKSDCLDIRSEHEGTILINYSNPRNYAGLIYDDTSPAPSFYLRVPAMFYDEREIEEDEELELTNMVVMQNNAIKTQRLLKTDSMPHYMHKKLQLVLKHQTVSILSAYWIKEEPYEAVETDRRNPLQKYMVWLTDKDSIQRNVL